MPHDSVISTGTRGRTQNDEQVWRTQKDKEHSQPHRSFILTTYVTFEEGLFWGLDTRLCSWIYFPTAILASETFPFDIMRALSEDWSWYILGKKWIGKIKKLKKPENRGCSRCSDSTPKKFVCYLYQSGKRCVHWGYVQLWEANKMLFFSCVTLNPKMRFHDSAMTRPCVSSLHLFFWVFSYGFKVVVSTSISIYIQSRKEGGREGRKEGKKKDSVYCWQHLFFF